MKTRDIEEIYRLSPLQQNMLVRALLSPESDALVVQFACEIRGPLDLAVLRRAWEAEIARHAVLRTSFHWEETAHPVQLVQREVAVPWAEHDWGGLPAGEQDRRWDELCAKDGRPFDLTRAPLVRLAAARLAPARCRFLWSHHHLVLDGWSVARVLEEVFTIYEALARGAVPALPSARPYRDFIAWLRRRDAGGDEGFWRACLRGIHAPTPPPLARERTGETGRGLATRTLDARESQAVEGLARAAGVTPSTVLQGAFGLLLARLTGEPEAMFGMVVAGRPAELPGVESMVGLFINAVPVRVPADPGTPLGAWLGTLLREQGAMRRHEQSPLVEVQGWSGVPRGTPLFHALFIHENYPLYRALRDAVPGLEIAGVRVRDRADVPLSLTVVPGDATELQLDHDRARYRSADAARLLELLCGVLGRMAAGGADAPLASVAVSPDGRGGPLEAMPDGGPELEPGRTIHGGFEEQAGRNPAAEAVSDCRGTITYGELEAAANRLARRLLRLGLGPEQRVAVLVGRSRALVVALLGTLKAGGAYVPLDPRWPAARLESMAADAGVSAVVIGEDLPCPAGGALAAVPQVRVAHDGALTHGPAESAAAAGVAVHPAQAAYVLYTSGSTGTPKGVVLAHCGVASFLAAMRAAPGLASDDVVLSVTTISFDIAALELFLPLVVGARVALAGEQEVADADELAARIETSGATVVQATPTLWQMLLATGWDGVPHRRLRALCGGEPMSASLASGLGARVAELWNLYGPTETTIWSTALRVEGDGAPPIGRPIAGTRCHVLDAALQPLPVGAPGELFIGGAGVARGYLGRPGLTATRFVPEPGGPPGSRMYRTGDRARWLENGTLEFLGRLDAQMKVRGIRVEPAEVEAALLSHPRVGAAAVAVRGEGAGRLVAYVVGRDGAAPPPPEALREHAGARLPEALVPRQFVEMAALPQTANGKLDRRALPDPGAGRRDGDTCGRAPCGALEERLAALWAEVLGLERVGAEEHFFELGGHSVLATRLVVRIHEALGVRLPLATLFEAPTVADLARRIAAVIEIAGEGAAARGAAPAPAAGESDAAHGAAATPADRTPPPLPRVRPDPAHRHEPFPLTDVQQAYWVGRSGAFELGEVATHVYAEVDFANLDVARLEAAWRRLIARHEMLRAVVLPSGVQQILPEVPPYVIEVEDLAGRPAADARRRLEEIRAERSHEVRPADRWPLFDLRASRLEAGRVRLHVSFDLLIGDARSFQVLLAELGRLLEDPAAEFPALELSFRDYVLAERALRDSDLHRDSLEYWRRRLPHLPAGPDLPLAADPAAMRRPRFARRQGRLEPAAWRALRAAARARGLSASGVLLAAFAEVLGAWSRSPRFTINLTLFHRLPLHPQVDDVVGDFTSIDLFEVEAGGGASFAESASRVQRRLWEDLDHRFVSGVRVMRELGRASGGAVLMPVVFTSLVDEAEAPAASGARSGEVVYGITQTPQVWLDHQATEDHGALVFTWDAVEELFPPGLLDDLFAAYRARLGRLADDESAWTAAAAALAPAAQLERRARINHTAAPLPEGTLHGAVLAQAARTPAAAAVVTPDRTLDYASLRARSLSLAGELRERGAAPETLVAVVLEKDWEQAVAVLGVLSAGAAYLPLDPRLPAGRLQHLLRHGECRLAVTSRALDAALEWPPEVERIVVRDDQPAGEAKGTAAEPGEDALAYVIYTSGSTGEPKGVMIEHGAALNTIADVNRRFAIGPADRVLAISSLGFDLSVWDLFGPLSAGGAVIVPRASVAPDPARWAESLAAGGVTVWNSVPALMEMMVEYLEVRGERLPATLRFVLLSGDWIPVTLPARIRALAPGVRIVSLGGATEASIWSIVHPIERIEPGWTSIPYGVPMANQSFHVLDPAAHPCPDWVPGELHIGGAGLARGYWRDEARTRERFVVHPRSGERLYRTGDLGRWRPEGVIEFLGREDSQVKVQGHRIELGEIEHALLSHPGVRAAAVTVHGGAQEARRLVGYVVPAASPPPPEAELATHLRASLPAHMVPGRIVALERLPLTANGKVDRGALRDPRDERAAPPASRPVDAAADETRERIGRIVAEILGVERIEPASDLLELGASSVEMVRVVNRLDGELGFRPSIEAFYRDPTVRGLERAWHEQQAAGAIFTTPLAGDAPWMRFPLIADPDQRAAFKRARPGLRRTSGPVTPLSGGEPAEALERRLAARRSHRRFGPSAIPHDAFARLLDVAREVRVRGRERRLYGSAGGIYPVQLYVHTRPGGVEAVGAGTFYYDPVAHALAPVAAGAELDARAHELVNQPIAAEAAFALYLVGRLSAIAPLYGEHSLRFCWIEAGLMSQLLEQAASAAGIGLCAVGTMDFGRVRPVLGLEDGDEFLYAMLGGAAVEAGDAAEPDASHPEPHLLGLGPREEFEL